MDEEDIIQFYRYLELISENIMKLREENNKNV